jgi:hypothetical protein
MKNYAKVVNGKVEQIVIAEESFIDSLPFRNQLVETDRYTVGGVHYDASGNPDGATALRGNFGAVGYTYDAQADVFYAPQPYPSWTLDSKTWTWLAPSPYPKDNKNYYWEETNQAWTEIPLGTPDERDVVWDSASMKWVPKV